MSFGEAVKTVFVTKYADFKGRARRSEYWWAQLGWSIAYFVVYTPLFVVLISSPTDANGQVESFPVVGWAFVAVVFVFVLASIVPLLAVLVRRLHDTGRSGWWYFISLVPFGSIVLLIFALMEGERVTNQWGPDPKL